VEPHGQSPQFLFNAPEGRHPGQRPWLFAAGVNIASIFNNFINRVKMADEFSKNQKFAIRFYLDLCP
jgi:hypothetical protein